MGSSPAGGTSLRSQARYGWQASEYFMITVYVIQSLDSGKRYVGMTRDLEQRLEDHRLKQSKGGQQLGAFKLIYTEAFEDYAEARKREKYLKSGTGREWLLRRIPRDVS